MTETSFYVTDPAKAKLIAHADAERSATSRSASIGRADVPMKWESGGGGMVSTMADYARFSQMLLNGGSLDGRQYLSPEARSN